MNLANDIIQEIIRSYTKDLDKKFRKRNFQSS